jgi:hypothetical protein
MTATMTATMRGRHGQHDDEDGHNYEDDVDEHVQPRRWRGQSQQRSYFCYIRCTYVTVLIADSNI